MSNVSNISLFIFRRDLRLKDNTALIECYKNSDIIIPIFIFTPHQIEDDKNKYYSNKSVQFMIESLEDLQCQLMDNNNSKKQPIIYFYGENNTIIKEIYKHVKFNKLYLNEDYTPYSIKRDNEIKKFCGDNKIIFESYEDICLFNPRSRTILTGNNEVYKKFTPFYNKCMDNIDKIGKYNKSVNVNNISFIKNKKTYTTIQTLKNIINPGEIKELYNYENNYSTGDKQIFIGGTNEGKKRLKSIKQFKDYGKKRNELSQDTTRLSPYLKYGCLSVREVYETMKKYIGISSDLIKQLIWRDFYIHLMYDNGYMLSGWYGDNNSSKKGFYNNSLKSKYDEIKWSNSKKLFKKWCEGKTGFPIIDACMMELNESGYMHNRGRLISASFLIKILQIDWRWGERYFSTKLVDYDPAVNNGNWQWVSGSGADSQPYFRIFNTWTQSEKHDKQTEYIKKWLPQLEKAGIKPEHLHKWDKYYKEYDLKKIGYYKPIVDYNEMRNETLEMYKEVVYN